MRALKATAASIALRYWSFVKNNSFFFIALIPVLIWCIPYLTTGKKMEMGDFSFFSQGYEAIKISVLEYKQFPWWNPWVSGGIPLYANPQIGVFSITTLFALLFNGPVAVKLSLIIFTICGYGSMYLLLRKYYKVDKVISALISLMWVFCTFFVAHLPNHFTFAWYLLAPLYLYLTLTIKDIRSGLLFGAAFSVMALSQTHNPFVHIALICVAVFVYRLIIAVKNRDATNLLRGIATAAIVFILIAGHRVLLTYENLFEFPRNIVDKSAPLIPALLGFFAPYSQRNPIDFITYPEPPIAPHGFHEISATIGVFGIFALILAILYFVYCLRVDRKFKKNTELQGWIILALFSGVVCFLIALGEFASPSPYGLLKKLPVVSDMRLSTRWYIWANLAFLIMIGVVTKIKNIDRQGFAKFGITALLVLGCCELFFMNVGYQYKILSVNPVAKEYDSSSNFKQQSYYNSLEQDPASGQNPLPYQEYNSMMYNTGVIYANDALVQIHLARISSPRCGLDTGCHLIKTGNAKIIYWSPNKVVLQRTADGPIELNINKSSYMNINGHRYHNIKTAEPFEEFVINNSEGVITIEVKPSLIESIRSVTGPEPSSFY